MCDAVSVDLLFVRTSHRKITFEPGVDVAAISGSRAYERVDASLFSIFGVINVSVVATGATLHMHKLEYTRAPYTVSEYRATLQIRESASVSVVGGTYRTPGGDGIFLQNYGPVSLRSVTTDGAWRNGLSVISANGLHVVNSAFMNTNGTAPQCGIDIEPDSLRHGPY
jgi:hypothetical protein